MSSTECSKERCHVCNPDGISYKETCNLCGGSGYLYFVNNKKVNKEQFREQYNSKVFLEDEYSPDYCYKCNRFIKHEGKSPEECLCDNCYHEQEEREEE